MSDETPHTSDSAPPPETPSTPTAPCETSSPFRPEIREALEPTCCGSGCDDCPF